MGLQLIYLELWLAVMKTSNITQTATSWKPVNDTTWEFKLRKGVKWHDGSSFSADDVMFTVERAQNVQNSPQALNLLEGQNFQKIDDHTIHVVTEKPYPLMPNDLTL